MSINLNAYVDVLNKEAEVYMTSFQKKNDRVPTFSEFEKHLYEHCGIQDYDVVDKEKWVHFLLSSG